MSTYYKIILSSILTLSLAACSVANMVVDPFSKLKFEVAENINPDINGRPSPVVVKVFELSSRTLFDNQDFFALFDDADSVLGPDLISKTEFDFEPNSKYEHSLSLSPGVRYAGVLVAYRDIDTASWREVVEIDPTNYEVFNIHVGKLSVFVSNP
ncbi:type VI secretion system lipoprotein TssJ [Vibrio atypicus]|uniref:type VI secretion system lipoprotein TssJ n=1 Tax=Vibrio atypicus TaxID=558271 RepID=UPI003735A7BC